MYESRSILVLAPADETFAAVESALGPATATLRRARTVTELIKHLETWGPDVVVCSIQVDRLSIDQLLGLIKETDSIVPVILVGPGADRAHETDAAAVVESIDERLLDTVTSVTTQAQIRQELRRHRTLSGVVRDLSRTLFDADSVEEIEHLIHEQLTTNGLFQFVWIGEQAGSGTFDIHVPIESTIDASDLPGLDDANGVTALQQAVDDRSVVVVNGTSFTRNAATARPSPAGTLNRGHSPSLTAAVVPFIAEDTVVGLAVVATDRVDGIDEAERSVLESLGSLVGTAIWLVDARETLEQAQQRVEEFSGVIAHEIRNPLAIAMTQLQLVREGENGDALDRIESSLQRIDRQVNNLMTLASGLDPETVTERPLAESASEAWEDIETPGAELVIESSASLRADHDLLVQLFANVYRNAIEQVEGAEAAIRVGVMEGGFYVADNGPGIPPDQRDLVFEWGYSETAGLGIGLTVVREICRVHGWTIHITDSATGGARFEIQTGDGLTTPSSTGDRLAELFSRDSNASAG